MSSRYLTFPIPVDAQDLMQAAFAYMKIKNPSWEPSEGQLDTWIIEAISGEAADIGTLASQVDKTIFKSIGELLFGIPAISATASTATINITAIDSIGHTFPAGMQVGIRDALNNLIPFKLLNDAVIPAASSVVNGVLIASSVEGSGTAGLGSIGGNVEQIDTNQYVLSITQATVSTGGTDEESDDTYRTRLAIQLQTMSPRPILTKDFAILARNIAGIQRALVIDGLNTKYNVLTVNQATTETDATGWSNGGNATLASTAAQAAEGTKSISLTAIAGADMSAFTPNPTPPAAGSFAVRPGDLISGIVSIRANTTVRSCQAIINWYDSTGAFISSTLGAAANDSNAAWTVYTVQGNAPLLSAYATLVAKVTAPVLGEVHYVDKALIGKGNITTWQTGGFVGTLQERMVTIFSLDSAGAPISSGIKAAEETYLEGLRELNFMVNTADATVNQVDVTVTFTVLPDYSLSDVQSRVTTAIQTFLNPKYWGVAASDDLNNPSTWNNVSKVYYLELATAINNVAGLDRILTLTIGLHGGSLFATDLTLSGTAPIPNANTIAATGSYA